MVFLHGFRSDMGGTKAEALAERAAREGQGFLRFDLTGHGESSGKLAAFGIGDWLGDVSHVLDNLTDGPVVLVGSSLGGWLSLLYARANPQRVAGLVTIAAAPDFTLRMEAEMTETERRQLAEDGHLTRPSAYSDKPDLFSRRLFDQGRENQIFGRPLKLPMPVRMLQGTADVDVPMTDALRLLNHAEGEDIRLLLVKGADHSFSTPECLAMIETAVAEVSGSARD